MRQYSDTPMDFADASLVAAAESLNISRILTLDRHFYAYRINSSISIRSHSIVRRWQSRHRRPRPL